MVWMKCKRGFYISGVVTTAALLAGTIGLYKPNTYQTDRPDESVAAMVANEAASVSYLDRQSALQRLRRDYPGVATMPGADAQRIGRVFGRAFGHGPTPEQAAGEFINNYVQMWGVTAEQMLKRGPFPDGRHITPMLFDRDSGTFRFTGLHFTQALDGIPVFRGRLTLLVRNEQNHPLVLASSDLRPLGDFIAPAQFPEIDLEQIANHESQRMRNDFVEVSSPRHVIFAGVEDRAHHPTLGIEYISEHIGPGGYQKWLTIIDAHNGIVLYRENQIVHNDVAGSITAMTTDGLGAGVCHPLYEAPLPYARVMIDGLPTYADENGMYSVEGLGSDPVTVGSGIRGQWFRVINQSGSNWTQATADEPPATVDFHYDPTTEENEELALAQIDAYIHANIVRDFTLDINPAYPVIGTQTEFPINVNIGNNCNAFYNNSSINFYTSGGGCNNTAFDTVVYHEYGHHLVNVGGSGQGQYGEGMSDAVALLITDDPVLGRGFSSCGSGIRSANNSVLYPCFGGVHACGRLLSGSVWDLRNLLESTEPGNARAIVSDLTINSILLHIGSTITPQIVIDFLTLNDDNDTIFDGTPHFDEIMEVFLGRNMDPSLPLLEFTFPEGLPNVIHPATGYPLRVDILSDNGELVPGTAVLHFDDGAELVNIPMTQLGAGQYVVDLPPMQCAIRGRYYFTAETTLGYVQRFPAIDEEPIGVYGGTVINELFADDFETDTGWTVDDSPELTDGTWERGVPAGGGFRSDPPTDADGSGQCYLTANRPGNSDVDDGATTLTSPQLDATNATVLSYWRWYHNSGGASPFNDVFIVEVSDDNGETWNLLEQVGPGLPGVSGGWIHVQHTLVGLPDFERNDAFRVRFIASDWDPQALVEAAVDGVELIDVSCLPILPGDITGDGLVDVNDLLAIIAAWGPCEPAAPCWQDANGDGLINVQDLLLVISNWGSGL